MKKVGVGSLSVNSYFSKNIFLDDGYVLLSPDTPVNQELINRLHAWSFMEVYTDGEIVSKASVDIADLTGEESSQAFLEKKVQENENIKAARAFYFDAFSFTKKVFDRFQKDNAINLQDITEKVKQMIESVRQNKEFLLRFQEFEDDDYPYTVTHSVRSVVLIIALGDIFKFPPFKLIELGVAALVHEIGIVKFPESLFMTDSSLNFQEKKNITAHPLVGYKGLKAVSAPPSVLMAVLEHHERNNGSGYPRNLTGDKISGFGKILSLVCTYESAVSPRPYKEPLDAHEFLLELLKDKGQNYDESIVRSLVFLLSVFPIGSYVEMSNGAKAMVVQANPADPRYPVVRLITDPDGNKLKDQIVFQTKKDNSIQISRCLSRNESKGLGISA